MLCRMDKTQTDRQTDGQTGRPADEMTEYRVAETYCENVIFDY